VVDLFALDLLPVLVTLMKKERWYDVSVLHLRGRNESTLVSTEVLVSLDGIIGCRRTGIIIIIIIMIITLYLLRINR
jgi:hypothetical protein